MQANIKVLFCVGLLNVDKIPVELWKIRENMHMYQAYRSFSTDPVIACIS